RLVEGVRPLQIADRQADEDQFGHEGLLFWRLPSQGRTTQGNPDIGLRLFLVRHFRDGPQDQTRNPDIPWCAIAHHGSMLRIAAGSEVPGLSRVAIERIMSRSRLRMLCER